MIATTGAVVALLLEMFEEGPHELGVQIRFTAISGDEYDDWVRAQSKGRYLISVLGPALTAAHLAAVSGIVAASGLNIDRIDRLSGRTPIEASGTGRMCIELSASGDVASEDQLFDWPKTSIFSIR